jgi:hypothetical protein
VFFAFLHRVDNSGGYVEREYAVGSGRIDLLVRWPHPSGEQRFAIELKVWRPGAGDPLERGLDQTCDYLDRLGLREGTLILFDHRPDAPPVHERARVEGVREKRGHAVTVVRA